MVLSGSFQGSLIIHSIIRLKGFYSVGWLTDPLTLWPTHSLTHSLSDPLTLWPTHSLTQSLTDSLSDSLSDSLNPWFTLRLTLSDSLTFWLTLTHPLSDPLPDWLTVSLSDSHTLTHPFSHWPTHYLTHPLSDTLTLSHTYWHAHPLSDTTHSPHSPHSSHSPPHPPQPTGSLIIWGYRMAKNLMGLYKENTFINNDTKFLNIEWRTRFLLPNLTTILDCVPQLFLDPNMCDFLHICILVIPNFSAQ